jgi:hypothetical protein
MRVLVYDFWYCGLQSVLSVELAAFTAQYGLQFPHSGIGPQLLGMGRRLGDATSQQPKNHGSRINIGAPADVILSLVKSRQVVSSFHVRRTG